jgi:small conductance mechanosensitive channel
MKKNSQIIEFLKSFWLENQENIVNFGKMILMAILVLLIAKFILTIARKFILKRPTKVLIIDEAVRKIFYMILQITVWVIASLMVLDIFGINTTGLLTVLGTATLAIGLALKDSLSNIASGILLLILRPYKLGDYVDCGAVNGRIIEIGLFATIITNSDGLFVSVPNSVIFGNPITNYSRNPQRLATIKLQVSYSDSLDRVILVLHNFMQSNPLILKDPTPDIQVTDLGNIAVSLTLRFWVATENYNSVYWQVKHDLKSVFEYSNLTIPQAKIAILSNENIDK